MQEVTSVGCHRQVGEAWGGQAQADTSVCSLRDWKSPWISAGKIFSSYTDGQHNKAKNEGGCWWGGRDGGGGRDPGQPGTCYMQMSLNSEAENLARSSAGKFFSSWAESLRIFPYPPKATCIPYSLLNNLWDHLMTTTKSAGTAIVKWSSHMDSYVSSCLMTIYSRTKIPVPAVVISRRLPVHTTFHIRYLSVL